MQKLTIQEQLIAAANNLGMSGECLLRTFYFAHRIADFQTPAKQIGMSVFVDDGFILALEIGNKVSAETINQMFHALFCSGLKVTALHRSSKTEGYKAHRHEFKIERN